MSDLIDRQAAIDAIFEAFSTGDEGADRYIAEKILANVPSVQPERPEQPESAWEYCAECDHIEMCRWYPYEGCEFRSLPSAQQNVSDINVGDMISRQAVKYLDLFAKTYCRDYSVTDDLVFRCKECEYEMPDGKCLVKCMVSRLCPGYREFGSMGDL